jgi:hypothetical protein
MTNITQKSSFSFILDYQNLCIEKNIAFKHECFVFVFFITPQTHSRKGIAAGACR